MRNPVGPVRTKLGRSQLNSVSLGHRPRVADYQTQAGGGKMGSSVVRSIAALSLVGG